MKRIVNGLGWGAVALYFAAVILDWFDRRIHAYT